jgi:hypothetical protein
MSVSEGADRTKISTLVLVIALVVGASVATTGALAQGVNPAQLGQAGWTCFNAGPSNWVHCIQPGADASPATISVRVFDTQDVNASEAEFLGTELLIHEDLYNYQPCPQLDGAGGELGLYEDLREAPDPLPYFACHHFEPEHH